MTELMQRYPLEILHVLQQVSSIGIPIVGPVKDNIRFGEKNSVFPPPQQSDGKDSRPEAISVNGVGHRDRSVPIGAGRRQDRAAIGGKLHVDQMLVPEIERGLGYRIERSGTVHKTG
jgi:hypothetical protein